mgnify:CR=1 FL=1
MGQCVWLQVLPLRALQGSQGRGTDKWTHIPTTINSICGGWAKFANGDVGLFAGAR